MKVRAPSKIFIFCPRGTRKEEGRVGGTEGRRDREFHPFRNCHGRLFVTSQLTERANAFSSFQMTSSSKMDLLASAAGAPDNCRASLYGHRKCNSFEIFTPSHAGAERASAVNRWLWHLGRKEEVEREM